ncbi:MAG TPA: PAS domain-containing protein, partial [Syntrophorhabdaceae bacterium]|nr:PAS domain-containing protein [Syntrophorhabdaceae bacterium]
MNRHKGTLSLTIGFTLVAAFIVTTLVLYAVPETHWLKTTVFEPFLLLPLMTCIFLVLTSYAVTFFIMKSYLLSGAPILLYFGAGILTLGTGSLASSWFMAPYGPNVSITILNVSVLATAMFHMAGIIMRLLERRAEPDLSRRRLLLVMCWGSVLVSVALLSLAAVRGLTPTFFVPGTGPTLIRQATLMATLLLLVLSFACMMVFYFETKIRTLCWYALALGFLLVGIGSIYLDNSVGSILGWLGRLSQYFAGVYFVVASVSALNAARKNGILLTETLSDAFQRSERRVSAILESMTDCHYELDRNLLFTRINDKALAFFKKNRKDLIGHSIAEVFNLSIDNLIPRFTKVMNERVGVHFEFESELEPGKWVEVHSYPVENGISVYFRDISEHKQKENEIRHLASFPGLNPNPVIEADLQGNICYLNTAAENVLSPRPLSLNSWMIGF